MVTSRNFSFIKIKHPVTTLCQQEKKNHLQVHMTQQHTNLMTCLATFMAHPTKTFVSTTDGRNDEAQPQNYFTEFIIHNPEVTLCLHFIGEYILTQNKSKHTLNNCQGFIQTVNISIIF